MGSGRRRPHRHRRSLLPVWSQRWFASVFARWQYDFLYPQYRELGSDCRVPSGRRSLDTTAACPFSGEWPDSSPAMSPDGSYLVFESNRPAIPRTSDSKEGEALPGVISNLWRVDRVGHRLEQAHAPTRYSQPGWPINMEAEYRRRWHHLLCFDRYY